MTFRPPEQFNIADHFLDARIRDGMGDRTALITAGRTWTYRDVQSLANRYGSVLRELSIEPEQRVIVSLPDGPEYVAALFGVLKIGAAVVMVNPHLSADAVEYFCRYTRAKAAFVDAEAEEPFAAAADAIPTLKHVLSLRQTDFQARVEDADGDLDPFPTHRDDPAIWLFSGGTTGHPKAVVQTHTSYANTTACYAHQVIRYGADDITLSVPKLYFGYATGSNLLFPFSVGAAAVLFPERCTADVLFDQIRQHRPTILINVPTMINQMVNHPEAADQDLSCLRLCTSAGEALPVELHERWSEAFGVELLDGLGTAEMWHIFISNRPGRVRPGTLGEVVPGFEVRVRDEDGNDLPDGEVGRLWVRGNSRAICYWQEMEKSKRAFRGEWYVSGDMIRRDADGYVTYCGRADDMLKVSGKWLAPQEVESCLLQHPSVEEAAVIGVEDDAGLTVPRAFVVVSERRADLDEELKEFVRSRLETYKHPREVVFLDGLPRTHLGKVDRGRLRSL